MNPDVDEELDRIRRERKERDGAGAQSGKNVLPGTEFADLSTTSRKVWLVHHLLAVGEVSIWYGEPGSGKSVGIEDCGLHVAAGRLWHGRKVMQCAVLYVALERAAVVARRAIAWGIEHGLSQAQLPFKMVRGPLDFREPQTADCHRRHARGSGASPWLPGRPGHRRHGFARPVRRRRKLAQGHGAARRQHRAHPGRHRRPCCA